MAELSENIAVAILGGTGFGAGELLRLLTQHPRVEVLSVTSTSQAGQPIEQAHPHLKGFYSLSFDSQLDLRRLIDHQYVVVFSALPHRVSSEVIAALLDSRDDHDFSDNQELIVIDLSGDFRLSDPVEHSNYYPESVSGQKWRKQFCYGLSELRHTEICSSKLIANPGCYATACSLSVAPLIDKCGAAKVVFDAKSGSSGAGRTLTASMHHPERNANFSAYKVLEHRHQPEIQQILGDSMRCTFVPHVIPVSRGIFVTAHIELDREISSEELLKQYQTFFSAAPFIRLRSAPPELRSVVGSNFCDISVTARGRDVVVMAALDNLIKGMSGQAIQNMNLACGLDQTLGLWTPAIGLV